jgi:hypothetical protein
MRASKNHLHLIGLLKTGTYLSRCLIIRIGKIPEKAVSFVNTYLPADYNSGKMGNLGKYI